MLSFKTTTEGGHMFRELTDEFLDLRLTEKGYGSALYANEEEDGGGTCCSSSCSTLCISLCCTI
jgi:hypothetical protein